ncbi:MAG TPA: hypothetical protein VGC56_01075 [Allosphingosinicella sp.]|jgi:hypothetical protein
MRWFKPMSMLFRPVSPMGWLLTILAAAFCAHIFWFVDHHSHSNTDTLYGIFPYWAPTLLGLAWIADRTGGRAAP